MSVPFKKVQLTMWAATEWQLISPNDSVDLPFRPRGILVGTSGDVRMADERGTITTVPALVAGILHPFSPTRIYSTGTTAVGILIAV